MKFYRTVFQYLKMSKVRISEDFLRDRMLSHPDYPSLVSLSDTLSEIKLPYTAFISDKEKYSELNYPLIAHLKIDEKNEFVIVRSKKVFDSNANNIIQKWDGVL